MLAAAFVLTMAALSRHPQVSALRRPAANESLQLAQVLRPQTSNTGLLFRSGRPAAGSSSPGAPVPLTIFYNGTVATFNLSQDKAEAIIRWTERTTSGVLQTEERPATAASIDGGRGRWQQPQPFSLDKLGGDLPLARKRSLQRFLEKRKEG
ncbi:hypothetical protein Taro_021588 [Colocasia esculenta]|uniref:Protein TIFY n=1 Tax=Colocasia esculenta TaxID=4460 RepID=A0A843V8N0_COLES|nr:hypothetical protein [Colocasia esculenta]